MLENNVELIILVLALLALVVAVIVLWRRRQGRQRLRLEKDSSGFWRYHKDSHFLRKEAFEGLLEKEKKQQKSVEEKKVLVVLTFVGDMLAKQHVSLAKLVDEIELNRDKIAEVVVKINSPGGVVPYYGHAFAQLERLRLLGVNLTAAVDVVAASGGYLMCLPAHKIIAAPFALVGSVGVVAFVPNVREFLLNMRIVPRTFTAGRYKRTVSLTDQATPEEEAHFQQQLESIHNLFQDAVKKYRPKANMDLIATGDCWGAEESMSKQLGLVDEIITSQDYLLKKNKTMDVIELGPKKSFWDDHLHRFSAKAIDQLENRMYQLWKGV